MDWHQFFKAQNESNAELLVLKVDQSERTNPHSGQSRLYWASTRRDEGIDNSLAAVKYRGEFIQRCSPAAGGTTELS